MINPKLTHSLYFILSMLILIMSCSGEDMNDDPTPSIGPSSITISHLSIYEKLPRSTRVGKLSTDVSEGVIIYTLVDGEGSTHNSDFKIESIFLKTSKVIDFEDGSSKQIRVKVSNGASEYEESFTININDLEGDYPKLSSNSFEANTEMPRAFGADNGNVSPDLELVNIPNNTNYIALSMIDEDDNGSYHWAVWNIPSDKTNIKKDQTWSSGVIEGNNSFGEGYIGPFPPSTHNYKISAYFLTEDLDLKVHEFERLETEMMGKLIAHTSINGKYTP